MNKISIKHLEPIIDRVHNRYPLLTKHQIIVIVHTFFEIIRELIIEGEKISIRELFTNMHLISYKRQYKGKDCNTFKVKLTTSKKLKGNTSK